MGKINFSIKKIHKVCAIILAVVLLSAGAVTPALAAEDPQINAAAVYLKEIDSDTVIHSVNADEQRSPASTTKIMTALLTLEACEQGVISLDQEITATETAWEGISDDSSTQNIQPGEVLTVRQLLYCCLISSANESCNILAEAVCGDVATFVGMMNTRAQELGCDNTSFVNTHGLTDPNHFTTAKDMAKIFEEAINNEDFLMIAGSARQIIPATNMSEQRELVNTNKLIVKDSDYYYEACVCGKTGYTEAAGRCLVSLAEQNGIRLISVVLGASAEANEDGEYLQENLIESARLLKWGYDNFAYREILTMTDIIASPAVELGRDADHINLVPQNSISVFCDISTPEEAFDFEVKVYTENEEEVFTAPIALGDVMGELYISLDGRELGSVSLISDNSVEVNRLALMKSEAKAFLGSTFVKILIIFIVLLIVLYVLYVIQYNKRRRKKRQAVQERIKQLEQERREGAQFK